MARPDDAKAALRALVAHADLIIHACLEEGGRIIEDNENQAALNQLRQHRLVFELDDELQLTQVNRVASDLIHHVTQSYRRQMSCAAANGIVMDLESIIEAFKMADSSHSKDLPLREAEVQELVASLIDTLRGITQRFTRYIHSEFSYVSDLEQRVHENRRALDEVRDLNNLFDTLTPYYLMDLAGSNARLQHLLMKVLRRNIERLRTDVIDAAHGLRENLAKLEKDQEARRQGTLIDGFLSHYEQNPSYNPDPDILEGAEHIPPALSRVDPLLIRSQPDIEDVSQHEELLELLAGALNRQDASERKKDLKSNQPPVAVQDSRDASVLIETDAFNMALDDFFDALPALTRRGEEVSSLSAYDILRVQEPVDVWLLGIFGRHFVNGETRQLPYQGSLIGRVIPKYSGSHVISDIVFRKAGTA